MQTVIIIIGILVLLTLVYIINLLLKSSQKSDDGSQKLMLDMIENVRKEVQDSGGKNRQEIQEKLDKITGQITSHQRASTENLQKQFQDDDTSLIFLFPSPKVEWLFEDNGGNKLNS